MCVFFGGFLGRFYICVLFGCVKVKLFRFTPEKKNKKNLLGEVDENGNLHPFWLKKKTS
jgi:hypothetical protein